MRAGRYERGHFQKMKKIFVVDDNTVNLLVAEEALSELYDVFTLSSATAMFDLLNKIIPDLILLDLLMPEINGVEALKRLKDDIRYADIPVMILSAKDVATVETLDFEMGVVYFIKKPFYKQVLLDLIKTRLGA